MAEWDSRKHADELDELKSRFPGWQVWALPHGNPTTHVTWCARPWPSISAGSAQELAEQIRAAHERPPHGSPSLASARSYAARARQLREVKEAATVEWERRKASRADREVTTAADPVERFYQRHGHPHGRRR